jgi:hypothetical protein
MTALFVAISLRWRKWLDAAACIVLVLTVLASLPFLLGFLVQALGWLCGLFHRPDDLWKECPWCF